MKDNLEFLVNITTNALIQTTLSQFSLPLTAAAVFAA